MESEAKWNDPVAHLRQALAQDAFSLYCQPIGALGWTMTYPMAEVLMRLREEEKALRPPGEFLPVMEHYGMMPELDRWVVRQMLHALALGSRIPRFCVNLSAQTLADRGFPAFFADELMNSGVPGDCLSFEIEETDALALPECTARFAATIGSLGSGVIIEGFGRARDCFEPLKAPCVQFVKLHGSLTRRLAATKGLDADMNALLGRITGMGIDVIADSVEELHSLRQFKALNIRYLQGFGIYPPHPIDSFTELQTVRAA